MTPLLSRWYAFGPWLVLVAVVWRQFGWRRALAIAIGGWLIAFAAEWASTAGPVGPFGPYSYRSSGLTGDWRILGVPVFDSLSFTWLACSTYLVAGWLGARGLRRVAVAALAVVAIDVVVDPIALQGAHWWLSSIYQYPAHVGLWYGVSGLNYLGWLVVGAVLQLWLGLWLGDRPPPPSRVVLIAGILLAGVMLQSTVLAILLGVGPSALAALGLLAALVLAARGLGRAAPPDQPPQLLVACALTAEARAVRSALGPGWVSRQVQGGRRWSRRRDPRTVIWESGLGLPAAEAASAIACPSSMVLVAGLAGACGGGWPIGSVGVGSRVLAPDGDWYGLDALAEESAIRAGAGRPAQLASLEVPADGEVERADLAQRGVDLVDMETSAWVRARPGRVAALRAVSDAPGSRLGAAASLVPPGASAASPLLVARLLLLHPGAVVHLAGVARSQRLALAHLRQAVALASRGLLQLAQEATDLPLGPEPAPSAQGLQ